MIKKRFRWVCFLVFMSILPGCTFNRLLHSTKIENPTFEFQKCDIRKVRDRDIGIECLILAQNPNSIGLKNIYVSYELFVDDKKLMNGKDIYVELQPNSETKLRVPATIVYNDLIHLLEPLLGRILSNSKTIPVTIKTRIYGKPTLYNAKEEGALYSFERRFIKTVDVPLPEDEINSVKDAIRNLF